MGAFTQGGKRRGLKVVGPLIGWAATNEEIICVTMATTPRGGGFQSGYMAIFNKKLTLMI